LVENISTMNADGPTALGPAVFTAIAMAS